MWHSSATGWSDRRRKRDPPGSSYHKFKKGAESADRSYDSSSRHLDFQAEPEDRSPRLLARARRQLPLSRCAPPQPHARLSVYTRRSIHALGPIPSSVSRPPLKNSVPRPPECAGPVRRRRFSVRPPFRCGGAPARALLL
ncbi:hypothetical protein HPB50_014608 [Hyalomma asiaticum]|uniref:Uncharacterized protein n=1 Tax=Hyalomma asiaticum TaxID=266040 RepID=A0ACB7TKM0_HYAAI|nr:hypothetical protein HPB50_014608 [Hyalomma asiaticum]